MRTLLPMGGWLAAVSAAAMIAGCAPTYTHPNKKMSREDVAIDALDCHKAAVQRHKTVRLSRADKDSPEARRAANAAARAAFDRCLKTRGWKKNG
jgi:hypothetical protein